MIYASAYAFATIDANKKLRSTDLVALEYADLNLKNFLGISFLQMFQFPLNDWYPLILDP
ncbi:hypothetical protein SLEP1_g51408 [Rubroshorea leprosula]|uniref:Uncharacterized protein n=1 Tax=Rubroshorea leprosula TaxID=152421 RepID=A0AAV5M418_9ROSI|nr:hypothetical protein SLEP1_g51408 [Rubroshorea leprosula]